MNENKLISFFIFSPLFSSHFVRTGKFDEKYGQLLSELFDWRQKGDYENILEYNNELVDPVFEPAMKMIEMIEK